MARLPRVIAVHGPRHVTQRGNARRFILESDTDRNVYLDLLKQRLTLHEVTMMGYCLMSNHVHVVLVPRRAASASPPLVPGWSMAHKLSAHIKPPLLAPPVLF
jgi:putative transposase